MKKYIFLLFQKKSWPQHFGTRFKANYLGKMHGYPQLSLWIPIAAANIYFFHMVIIWRKYLCMQHLCVVSTVHLFSKGTYSSKSLLSPFWIVVCHLDTKQFSFTLSDFLLMSFSIVSALIDPFIWAWSSWKLTSHFNVKTVKRNMWSSPRKIFFSLFSKC